MRAEKHRFVARPHQAGFFLIEAMVAILIFALGVLGLVAMGSTAVSAQSDAQYRTDAASLADAIAGQIALGIDRTGTTPAAVAANKAASLPPLKHMPGGANCAFAGDPTASPDVQRLIDRAALIMPGAGPTTQQVIVDPAPAPPAPNFNRVEITVCWRAPSDNAWRHHTLVTYVN